MCTSVDGYVPEHVIIDSDPARLLERMRAANRGGDVHLVGSRGPSRPTARLELSTSWE
jgi:hypothetical protein